MTARSRLWRTARDGVAIDAMSKAAAPESQGSCLWKHRI
ncbi:hypothetical protein LA76x_0956 [Lysobacter antibioticus]|uniref:Uncharacterized protein n=1 Tax=Lysobacter antibioticus TaxID=84531 RepID=A0A0S2F6P7_LYSAN|nr:hypothetical protein LA76x_0956 [Lysobacter antibioticus]